MKATEASLMQFLKKTPQLTIPIYQRTYSWTAAECRQLWDDIIRAGRNEDVKAHFIGSVVYIEQGLYQVSSQFALLVIDGQQRLTTVSILLEALARSLGDTEPVEGFSAKKLRNYYLLNPLEEGNLRYKLLLTQTDQETLKALVQQKSLPPESSLRLKENFELFQNLLRGLGGKLEDVCRGLSKLVIVDVSLNRSQDNPQLIFESMNSTGRELSEADLIRNYVLMGLEPNHQTKLYEDYWRPMEVEFGQEGYGSHFDAFMRHYLTIKTGSIPKQRAVYEAFKNYSRQTANHAGGVDSLVADVREHAAFYCSMALRKESDPDLLFAFSNLGDLKVDVAYPLLLALYRDYAHGTLPKNDFVTALKLVESYVFRRSICAIPTNSLNKTFATFHRSLNRERYLESIEAHFMHLTSYKRFPRDEEFEAEVVLRDMYNFPRRSYWLRRLENFGRKERVFVEDYTIEHIMPQNENLSPRWRAELGKDWERIHETKLHTIGNLTLTGYNSEYSDKPFSEKRDMDGGFASSPLRLNQTLGQVQHWDEEAIDARAGELAAKASLVWPMPTISDDRLALYKTPAKSTDTKYSLADHTALADGAPMRPVFDVLRRELLALDGNVTEEIRKLYVAYKAETNFVDVIPQQSRLQLSLNLPFADLSDPRGVAIDVSSRGRWGNGDVEVSLSSVNDISYALGLAKQALERQLGSDAEMDNTL